MGALKGIKLERTLLSAEGGREEGRAGSPQFNPKAGPPLSPQVCFSRRCTWLYLICFFSPSTNTLWRVASFLPRPSWRSGCMSPSLPVPFSTFLICPVNAKRNYPALLQYRQDVYPLTRAQPGCGNNSLQTSTCFCNSKFAKGCLNSPALASLVFEACFSEALGAKTASCQTSLADTTRIANLFT